MNTCIPSSDGQAMKAFPEILRYTELAKTLPLCISVRTPALQDKGGSQAEVGEFSNHVLFLAGLVALASECVPSISSSKSSPVLML